MNIKNFKKSLIFTLIFGLLAGNSLMGMSNALKEKVEALNTCSVGQAFALGFFTPQRKNAYHIYNIITGLMTLHSAYKTGTLNLLVYGGTPNMERLKPLVFNTIAYALGFWMRSHLDSTYDPRIDFSPETLRIISWALGGAASVISTLLFEMLNYVSLESLNEDIGNGFSIDYLQESPERIKYFIEQNPKLLFKEKNFITAINSLDQKQLNTLLDKAVEIYKHNPQAYTSSLIEVFLNSVTHYKKPSPEQLKLLIHFFETFQTLGCNSSQYYGLRALLTACNTTVKDEMVAEKYMHAFVHDVIKYCVETGMSIYKNQYSSDRTINNANHNPHMQNYLTMVGRYNKTLLTDKENLGTFIQKLDPEQQDDIFRIAASRGHLHALTLLTKLDSKKYSFTQAAQLALHRRIEKVLIKYFSTITDLYSNVEKTITNQQDLEYLKKIKEKVDQESSRTLDTIFNNTVNDQQKGIVTQHIRDMVLRAHPTKFDAMIKALKLHQEESKYKSIFYKTLK